MFKNNVFEVSVDTREWAKRAGARAIKTMAQAALASIPAAVTITAVDWVTVLGIAALSGVISLLTSVAGIPEVGAKESEGE